MVERYHHAGLNSNGTLCFGAEFDDARYAVWDLARKGIVWATDPDLLDFADGVVSDGLPALREIAPNGILTLGIPPVSGQYRLVGLFQSAPILEHSGIRLCLDEPGKELVLESADSGLELERHKYEDDSGDWAFASFCDDGSTIAVLTPYDVTLFRPS